MIIVTNDYGCGTSSSIIDYNLQNYCIVSEENWEHVFDLDDDVLLVGHDFLFYMWDTQEKVERWKKFQHAKILWCFERVDAIFAEWLAKSHFSIKMASQFVDSIYACDEDDCNKYGFKWLPQWASNKFYEKRGINPTKGNTILFSGQAGKIEYKPRTALLQQIFHDKDIKDLFYISNITRELTWDQYIDNFLSYKIILNPVGTLKALNTRAYEALYSGRILLQHTAGEYKRHEEMLSETPHVLFFKNYDELKQKIKQIDLCKINADLAFKDNNLVERLQRIKI